MESAVQAQDERKNTWQDKWTAGRIHFHRPEVHHDLRQWYDRMVPDDQHRTVLVPLCGKSLDMIW